MCRVCRNRNAAIDTILEKWNRRKVRVALDSSCKYCQLRGDNVMCIKYRSVINRQFLWFLLHHWKMMALQHKLNIQSNEHHILCTITTVWCHSEMFISTYIPTYQGNSLRKSLHNHRCYFGYTFEVRFCHVISFICTAISEIWNASYQVSKPNALMRWFSKLISVSLGSCDANGTDNISTLQN